MFCSNMNKLAINKSVIIFNPFETCPVCKNKSLLHCFNFLLISGLLLVLYLEIQL